MFLHLGGETVIRIRDIVAILNVEKNRLWYQTLPKEFQAKVVEPEPSFPREEIKSLVITTRGVYPSPISSGTLKKRAELFTRQNG
ncbi:MAG: extracellular matrix regulator RemB [Bacillota bacterium]